MNERIIGAIGAVLAAAFPKVPILDNATEQNVGRPAFFIVSTGMEVRERIREAGFFATYGYDIVFDPGPERAEDKCRAVMDVLMLELRRIPDLEGPYAFRPIGLSFHMEDGELHALFRIRESLKTETAPDPKIDSFSLNSHVTEVIK